MAVKSVVYEANLVADTHRGPTQAIWADCDVPLLLEQANEGAGGQYIFDDFNSGVMNVASNVGSFGRWAVYADTGGTALSGDVEGGVVSINSDTDNETVTFGGGMNSFRLVTTSTNALNQQLWFEARVAKSSIAATLGDVFVGLFGGFLSGSTGLPQAAIPITTADALANVDMIGFSSLVGTPTEWSFCYKLTGQAAVQVTGLTTLMNSVTGAVNTAGAFHKLGFRFDPNAPPVLVTTATGNQTVGQLARPLIKVFVDGLPAATFLSSLDLVNTNFPTAFMSPGFSVMNSTGTTLRLLVDWIRCAQLPNS